MEARKIALGFSILIMLVILLLPSETVLAYRSTVTLDNKSGQLTLVKILGPTKQTVAVTSGDQRSVHVDPGVYRLLIRYGEELEDYRYVEGEPFFVLETESEYSVVSIALHKVVGGNYPVRTISEAQFTKAGVSKQPPDPHTNTSSLKIIKTLTIRGRIANLPKAHVTDTSHLQLVHYPESERIGFVLNEAKSLMSARSDLAVCTIGKDGSFSFPQARLLPGRYAIAAQYFKGLGFGGSSLFLIRESDRELATLRVPTTQEGLLDINLGNLYIRLVNESLSMTLNNIQEKEFTSENQTDQREERQSTESKIRRFTITGEIMNWEKARKFIKQESYLQLVHLPADKRLSGKSDDQGRFTYVSALAKSELPSDGRFCFQNAELTPGRYLIVIQRHLPLMVGAFPSRGVDSFIYRMLDKQEFIMATVEIGPGPDEQLVRDLGKLCVIVKE